ncbi:MAG: ORF6N domain-containing protein [bacterium]
MGSLVPIERIEGKILFVRGLPVKVLNQAVRRNISRLPEDFMFQLTKEEHNSRTRAIPKVFTLCLYREGRSYVIICA